MISFKTLCSLLVTLLLSTSFLCAADSTPPELKPGFLGIDVEDSTTDADTVVVTQIIPGHTADDMGLQEGDIINTFNGKPVTSKMNLLQHIKAHHVGDTISVSIIRGTEFIQLSGTLGDKKSWNAQKEKEKNADQTNNETPQPTEDSAQQTPSLEEKSEKIKNNLQALQGLGVDLGTNDQLGNLATSMTYLATALDELPTRINKAATEFKKVYPDGEFIIDIKISVTSNAKKKPVVVIKNSETEILNEEGQGTSTTAVPETTTDKQENNTPSTETPATTEKEQNSTEQDQELQDETQVRTKEKPTLKTSLPTP